MAQITIHGGVSDVVVTEYEGAVWMKITGNDGDVVVLFANSVDELAETADKIVMAVIKARWRQKNELSST